MMRDKQLAMAAAIYILLSSIDPSYPGGKRGRKAVMKDVKKPLSIYSREDRKRYLEIVSVGEDCMHLAREKLVGEIGNDAYHINPGILLKFLSWRYESLMNEFRIKRDHINNINDHYIGTGYGFSSIKYGNKLVNVIENYSMPDKTISRKIV